MFREVLAALVLLPALAVAQTTDAIMRDIYDSGNTSLRVKCISGCGGGSGSPGGSDTQVQFNDAGAFGGDAGMTYNKTTDTFTCTNLVGALTGNASTATALAANPADCGANTFANAIAASGALTCAEVPLGTATSGNYAAGDAEAGNVAADKVLESSLKAVDAAVDEECLTYESTTGDFEWQACGSGSGDVVGPASSTDNAIARFDSTTGKLLQNGVGILGDSGELSGITTALVTGRATFGSAVDAAAAIDIGETANCVTFEGATADGFESRLCAVDPTADVTFNMPALSSGTKTLAALESGNTFTAANTFSSTVTLSNTSGAAILNDNVELTFGTGSDAKFGYQTASTPDSLYLMTSADSNAFTIAELADIAFDFNNGPCGTSACTNPTLIGHSANQSTTEWWSLTHNQTNVVADAGAGAWTFPDGLPEKYWLPMAGCNNASASPMWDLPTSNPGAAACVTGTNTQKGVLDFDATTDESAQTTIALPSDFTGTINAKIKWFAAATSGAAGLCVQLICVADAETDDPAYPAQAAGNCVSDTAKGTTLQLNDASITAVTSTGCAAGELMHVQFSRDANGGAVTDDMTGDARVVGVELTILRTQTP